MNRGAFSIRGRFTSASSSNDTNIGAINGDDWGTLSNEGTNGSTTRGGFGSFGVLGIRGGLQGSGGWSSTRGSKENINDDGPNDWNILPNKIPQVTVPRGGFGISRGESGSGRGGFGSFRGGFGMQGRFISSSNTNVNSDGWNSTSVPKENPRANTMNDWNIPSSENINPTTVRGGFGSRGAFNTSRGELGIMSTNLNINMNTNGSTNSWNNQLPKENVATNDWNTSINESTSSTTTRGGFGSSCGGFTGIEDGIFNSESSRGGRGGFSGLERGSSNELSSTVYGLESSSRGGFGALQISSLRGGRGANCQPMGISRGGFEAGRGSFGSARGGFGLSSNRFTTSVGTTDWGAGNDATRGFRTFEPRNRFQSSRGIGNPDTERRVRYAPVAREPEVLFAEDQVVSEKYANVIDEDEEVVVEDFAGEVMTLGRWEEAEFEPALVANLRKCNYIRPRKIQTTVIPFIIDSFDVKGHAETGSGKTAAYLLPILDMCMKAKAQREYTSVPNAPYVIIIAPTRELVLQISEQARKFADGTGISVAKTYGQYNMGLNAREIRSGCDILCATPRRLKHFVMENEISLNSVKFLVIDEADRLILEDTFIEDIKAVIEHRRFPTRENRQTLIFSATFPDEMKEATKNLLKPDAVFITNKKNVANKRIVQDFKLVTGNKLDEMTEMLEKEVNAAGGDSTKIRRTLVFTNTKKLSDFIAIHLCNKGIKASCINGDRSQQLREEALGQFRRGEVAVLVSTDVCCRGIDIKHLDHVINYDVPTELVQYIHRIGRTGRICQGYATTFVTDPCDPILQEIAQVIRDGGKEMPESLLKLLDNSIQPQSFGNFRNVNSAPQMAVLDQEDW